MNATSPFLLHEQELLPLVGGISVIVLSGCTYLLARRWGQPRGAETFKQKLFVVQSLVSAFLLGQIVGHTTLFTASFPLTFGYLFTLGGILILRHVESFGRGWNPEGEAGEESAHDFDDVNPETMEQETYVRMADVGSKQAAALQWRIQAKRRSNAKRQWMLGFLIASFAIVATMNGFLLVYHTPPPSSPFRVAHIVCFLVNCAAQTMAILGGMIHAGFHVTEEKRRRFFWWAGVSLAWFCVIVCSTIPVLIQLSPSDADAIVNTPYFSSVYLFVTGLLWRLSYYYEKHLYVCRNRRELALDAIVFTLSLALSATTGFWL